MNRFRSKVLSMLLILVLVFTSTGMVFGAETGLQKISSQENAAEVLNSGTEIIAEQEAADQSSRLNSGQYTTMTPINATTIMDSTTSKTSYPYPNIQPNSGTVIPVVAQNTGMMYMDATNVGNPSDNISVYLCETYNGATAVDGYYYYKEWNYLAGGESKTGDSGMPVIKGTTYYITIESASYNKTPANITISPYVYTTEDRELSAGTSKWTIASGRNIDASGNTVISETWFKIKPDKTGKMAVNLSEFDGTDSGKIGLYNSNKKALSEEVLYYNSASNSSKAYFGVKKGTTYYLKVSGCYGDSQYKYGVQYSVEKKTDRNLAAKKKAKNLKRKAKATESLFVASTGKSTDWYKIKVTSKRKTVIHVDTTGMTSGKVTITAYKGSKRVKGQGVIDTKYEDKNDFTLTYGTSYGKANAGTYYIKVVKDKNASGSYKIKYKK